MKRTSVLLAAALTAGLGALGVIPVASPAAAATKAGATTTVFTGSLTVAQFKALAASGIDRSEISSVPSSDTSKIKVEVVLNGLEARALIAKGVPLAEKRIGGTTASAKLAAEAVDHPAVYRSYSEKGGLRDEYTAVAKQYPGITKLETIGRSIQGQPIIALKVTKGAQSTKDGSRPSVLYVSNQHAREWITPEMNRRLMHHMVEGYATDASIKKIVDTTELWFIPSANPDGYDYTFTEGNRLWRKNLHDNDGDGEITGLDGVDPNRNYPEKWGYDNEGSSGNQSSETYRGTAPASEPETKAMIGLMSRVKFKFMINYHSAAELILYGVGWQVATPSPDDTLYEALAGDDANPAIPGYDPDISAELYTTNGETDDYASSNQRTLSFTPEMSTCQTASAIDPDDAFDPADCISVFDFPDSETLIQAEYLKNVPFAMAVAQSAQDPDDPISVVGRTAPDFVPDAFTSSYGDPQTVAVTARRALKNLTLNYSINGRTPVTAPVKEWNGGERYGAKGDNYYAEYRGVVKGAKVGDRVKVWFTGARASAGSAKVTSRASTPFTYQQVKDSSAKVLVLANEDYTGVNPTYPASVTAPKYAQLYQDALKAKGISSVVWDVDKQGVPHDLGVLGHFKAVVWYLGDNRLTQDPEDELISYFGSEDGTEDLAVAERQQYLTLAVRDYLNAGGKLVHTGETAAYYGQLGSALGGIYYGLDGAPDQECVVTSDPFSDCLLLADDFSQYYLGAYGRSAVAEPQQVAGDAAPFTGVTADLGGNADNPLDEAGNFTITSDVLPVSQFPQFASQASASYLGAGGGEFDPVEGTWYDGTLHADDTYTRLARTVDLSTTTAAQTPSLDFQLSYDTEPGYDNLIVEAHPVGSDAWTTLPEAGGLTDTDVPDECEAGFLLEEHPFLEHYLTNDGTACTPTGTTGSWNRMTGNSGGWQQVSFDLSAYAGQQVEVAISYVTDSSAGGAGVFVDDTRLTIGGTATEAEGFETGLGPWSTLAPPAGSPPPTLVFTRSESLFSAAVTTKDSVLLGFGIEQVASPADRATLLGKAVGSLIS